jgi:hypothetical protein
MQLMPFPLPLAHIAVLGSFSFLNWTLHCSFFIPVKKAYLRTSDSLPSYFLYPQPMAIKSAPSLLKHSGTKQTGATLGVISTGPSSVRTAMSFSFEIDKTNLI